ncbi:MAG: glycosyltransferase [Novosphingobium sp.]|nr:glycosyltransferase [Novosphingobium sp.]
MKKNIIFSCPAYSMSGYGAHSRDMIEAIWNSGKFNLSILANGWGGSTNSRYLGLNIKDILDFCNHNKITEEQPYTFVHVGIPTEFKRNSKYKNIGVTAGLEADRLPNSWVDGCRNVDLLIVPTQFEKDLFIKSGVKTRIEIVNEGVDTEIFHPLQTPIPLPQYPTKFNFLAVGQWLNFETGTDRKQIGLLLELFLETFKENEDVGLVLKTYHTNFSTPDLHIVRGKLEELKNNIKSKARLYLLHGELYDKGLAGLYTHPDIHALISLTSGEGWGRPLAEAMACDLPIIATGWSGHTEFLNANNSVVLPYVLRQIPQSNGMWFEKNMKWAYVNINDVILAMRDMIINYDNYKKRATIEGVTFREKFNKKVVYQKLIELLEE